MSPWNPASWFKRNDPLPSSSTTGNPRGSATRNAQMILPGTGRNYQARAGDLWANSIVMAAVGWIGSNIHQAPLVAYRQPAGSEKPVRKPHEIDTLLARPNRFYGSSVLLSSTLLSLCVDGNAYWYIVRDQSGLPKELWYVPHTMIEPSWPANASTEEWITHYTYRLNGIDHMLPVEDVIHFREGAADPRNVRKSLSRLKTALRQVATDNEIATYEAAIVSNLGVPGLIVSPKESDQALDVETTKEIFDDRVSGDNRGSTIVMNGAIDVHTVALSPEQMMLGDATEQGEARICSLIGINPVVLALAVGLKHSTFNNQAEARQAAWEDGIVPRLLNIAGEVNVQLAPLYADGAGLIVAPDLSQVRALAPSQDALYKRLVEAAGGPFLTVNEARVQAGHDELTGDALAAMEAKGKKSPATTPTPGDNNNGA